MRLNKLCALAALSLSVACDGGAIDDSGEATYLEDDVVSETVAELASCPSFTASNSAHVSAGRATATTRTVLFWRVTTYYALGSNESLGNSGTASTTLYQLSAQTYSRSSSGCSAAPDGGAQADAGAPSDASVSSDATVDAAAPADAGTTIDASTPSGGAGCGLTPPASGSKSIVVAGTTRSYVLAVPSNYDRTRPYPVVFAFHGLGGTGSQAQRYLGVQQASAGQAIVIYPDGLNNSWGLSGSAATADLAFFDALVADAQRTLCVDSGRLFATGHSMGGYFSNTLGCARGNTLRGIAPVAGGGPFLSCDGGKVAAWLMAARDDTVVAYTAGEQSRNRWVAANGCSSTTRPVGPGACVAYEGCDPGHPVHWCLENTGGHNWPSYGGNAIWSFFSQL